MTRQHNLRAYGLNLLGSLAGVALSFVVAFLWTPPIVWYALAFAAVLLLHIRRAASLIMACVVAVVGLAVLAWPVDSLWNRIYSPYQLLELGYTQQGLMEIRAAGQYYQRVNDLSRVDEADFARLAIRNYYDLPYRVHGAPTDVAIVGAGSGNDVAAAVRAEAHLIDAIEIDPAILAAGRANHPEYPYTRPNVRAIVNDARTFLRTTDRKYDVVVYGLLDSHTLLSHASSVRLDSFVYTVEGLREARARLKPGGVLALSFALLSNEMGRKIYMMLEQAFDGMPPLCIEARYDRSVTFLQAEQAPVALPQGLLGEMNFGECSARYGDTSVEADVSTDDWPFFYMARRTYPFSYLVMIAVVLALSVYLVTRFGEQPTGRQLPYFLLGSGFMLVETKGITEMGLTFGNTWQVIGIVISGILVMAFLANWTVQRMQIRRPLIPYLLLLASLAFGLAIAAQGGLSPTFAGRVATAVILTSPLFFSGIVFSSLLAADEAVPRAMAANLFGAMVGGLLEYNAMYFGFQVLYVLAATLYAGAFVSSILLTKKAAPVMA
jgi:SAM-dependent methyltransferase